MKNNGRRSRKLLAGAALLAALATTFWVVRPSGPGAAGTGGANVSTAVLARPALSAADQTCALLARHYPQAAAAGKRGPLTNESALRFTPNPNGPGFVPDQRALAEIEKDARERLAKPGWHPIDPAKYVRPVLPDTFAEAVNVRTGANAQWEARARPLGANSHCAAEVASDGTLVYKDAFAGCDVAYRASALKTEEFIVIREQQLTTETQRHRETTEDIGGTSAPPESGILHPVSCSPSLSLCASVVRSFSWELDVPAGLTPRLTPAQTIEFVDAQATPRLRINAPEGKDAKGKLLRAGERLRITLEGSRVTLAADLSGLQRPVVIDPSWSSTGSLSAARGPCRATLLNNGKVLVAGGYQNYVSVLATCEIYDPSTGTWTATASMATARFRHTATLLGNGNVLVAGGHSASNTSLNTCEIFDAVLGQWNVVAPAAMAQARESHTATLMPNGRVLVAGGYGGGSFVTSCEIYDPAGNSWTTTGALNTLRSYHTANLLANGNVLVSAGFTQSWNDTSCEIYDTQLGTWHMTASLHSTPRQPYLSVLLSSGLVLAADGSYDVCELFDPSREEWNIGPSPNVQGEPETVGAVLANGSVLLIGRTGPRSGVYIVSQGVWVGAVPVQDNYGVSGTATALNNGMVLTAGGATVQCELFDPRPVGTSTTISVLHGSSAAATLASDSIAKPESFGVVTLPQHGVLRGTVPNLTYTAAVDFVGTDSFTYNASDVFGQGPPATVNINVTNTAPVAADQTVSTHWGTAKAITLTGSDANGDALTFAVVAQPQHGTLTGTPPNATYTPTGTYVGADSFTFKANDGAADSNVATVSINVTNTAPTVTASASPTSVVPNGNVVFTANGTDADGDALSYSWVFGDGGTANEQNPTHSYSAVGVYTAVVTVTDAAGGTGSNSVTIQVSQAPTARLTTDDVVAFAGNPFQFDASYSTDPENAIASYTWDFGDGTPPGAGQIISKIYDQPGEYTVTLTVTDAAGVSDTLQRILEVLPASELGLFNGFVNYKTNWNRNRSKQDSISVDARVNVGAALVGPNTALAFEVAGQRFTGKLDKKLRDYTNSDAKWQVKASIRRQPFGTVTLKLTIKNADLGAGFNQAGALVGPDPHDWVKLDIPAKVEIGGHTFEVNVPSEFKFNRDGTKAKGVGAS